MPDTVHIRSFTKLEDYYESVDLQQRTWGPGTDDIVAPLLMMTTHKVGAVFPCRPGHHPHSG